MNMTKPLYCAIHSVLFLLLSVVNAQAVPEEARRHLDRSQAAVEMATSPADLEDAVRELQKAIELAPDWAPIPIITWGWCRTVMTASCLLK